MTLIEPNLSIPATGGEMAAYIARPTAKASGAAVLLFVELWGMTRHMKEVAERLTEVGHIAVVCDLFRGRTPPTPDQPKGEWAQVFQSFDDVACTNDCRMAANWIKGGGLGAPVDRVFAWGFCMGGRFAHNLGAMSDAVTGVINFYGRVSFPRMENKPFLPIEIAGLIDKPYLGVFAEIDDLIPASDISVLRDRLKGNAAAEIHVYDGVQHAFFNDHRPEVYDAAAADRAWTKVLGFIDETR